LQANSDHEQQLLARLDSDPAWAALRERAKEKMEAEFGRLAKALMRGDEVADVEYRRGFFAGIKFLLDCPTLEARKLDRALAKEGDTGSA
jgi:hypothetical protein